MSGLTEEREERLMTLWHQGHSGGEIGRDLRITRNAVIGKVHRLGLPLRGKSWAPVPWTDEKIETLKRLWPTHSIMAISDVLGHEFGKHAIVAKAAAHNLPPKSGKIKPPIRRPMCVRKEGPRGANDVYKAPVEPATHETDAATPLDQRKTLLELTSHTCRWPIGDVGAPDFFFCGAEPVDGSPYCLGHWARGRNPIQRQVYVPKSAARMRNWTKLTGTTEARLHWLDQGQFMEAAE